MDKTTAQNQVVVELDSEQQISELGELQLSLVAGGSGEVVFH